MKRIMEFVKKNILMIFSIIVGLLILKRLFFSKGRFVSVNSIGSSMTDDNAMVIANTFENYMSSLTGKSEIIRILRGIPDVDKRKVYNAFGKRNYLFIGKWQLLSKFIGDELTLTEWYGKEFRGSMLKSLRDVWNSSGLTI